MKKLTNNKFVNNVIILASGTALAQLISIAFSPIITRLYGPEAFGVLGVFTSLMSILTPVVALSYPIAIVLPKRDGEAKQLVKLSLVVGGIFTSILTVVLVVGGDWFLNRLNMSEITPYLFIIPVFLILSAFIQVARQWLIRKKQFKTTANVSVLQSLFVGGSKSGVGYFIPKGGALIILATIGEFFHCILLWIGVSKTRIKENEEELDRKKLGLLQIAKKYWDFPIFRAPQVTINALSQSLPTLFLVSFFGPASAGFYSLGKRILGLPSSLIANSVGEVFYPRIAEAGHRGERLTKLILKATLSLAGVGILPFAIIALIGPWLFSFVFGSEWVTAGVYARWLSIWLYFMFINKPSVMALPILKAQGIHLVFSIITILIRIGSLYIGYTLFNDDVIAIFVFSLSGAIINIVLITSVLFISMRYDKRVCNG